MNEHTADKIYRTLFKKPAPPVIRERFSRALEAYAQGFSDTDRALTARAVEEINDLEALEMAARWTRRLPLLVWEYKVLVHLGETLPENRPWMVSTRNRRIQALLCLAGSGLRSAWKLAKGYILLRRLRRG